MTLTALLKDVPKGYVRWGVVDCYSPYDYGFILDVRAKGIPHYLTIKPQGFSELYVKPNDLLRLEKIRETASPEPMMIWGA